MGKINIDLSGLFGALFGDQTAQPNPSFDSNATVDPETGYLVDPKTGIPKTDDNGNFQYPKNASSAKPEYSTKGSESTDLSTSDYSSGLRDSANKNQFLDTSNPDKTPDWWTKAFHPEIAQQEQNANNSWAMQGPQAQRTYDINAGLNSQTADVAKSSMGLAAGDMSAKQLAVATGDNPTSSNIYQLGVNKANTDANIPNLDASSRAVSDQLKTLGDKAQIDWGIPNSTAAADNLSNWARGVRAFTSGKTDTLHEPAIQPQATADTETAKRNATLATAANSVAGISADALQTEAARQKLQAQTGLTGDQTADVLAQGRARDVNKLLATQHRGIANDLFATEHPTTPSNPLSFNTENRAVIHTPGFVNAMTTADAGMNAHTPYIGARLPNGQIPVPTASEAKQNTAQKASTAPVEKPLPPHFSDDPNAYLTHGIQSLVNTVKDNSKTIGQVSGISKDSSGREIYTDDKFQKHPIQVGKTSGGRTYKYYTDTTTGRNIVVQ